MCGGTARVNDALGNAFVIEVCDLLAEDEVLEQSRPARRGPQRILIVRKRQALVGRQRRMRATGHLLELIAGSAIGHGTG